MYLRCASYLEAPKTRRRGSKALRSACGRPLALRASKCRLPAHSRAWPSLPDGPPNHYSQASAAPECPICCCAACAVILLPRCHQDLLCNGFQVVSALSGLCILSAVIQCRLECCMLCAGSRLQCIGSCRSRVVGVAADNSLVQAKLLAHPIGIPLSQLRSISHTKLRTTQQRSTGRYTWSILVPGGSRKGSRLRRAHPGSNAQHIVGTHTFIC